LTEPHSSVIWENTSVGLLAMVTAKEAELSVLSNVTEVTL
jgi:hypothetical protein